MKMPIYNFGLLVAMVLLFNCPSIAQGSEKSVPKTTPEEIYEDDLSPYPFDKKEPEKKTLGQKIKENLSEDRSTKSTPTETAPSEEYIRFYEFEDITFADREIAVEEENDVIGPIEDYKTVEDTYTYKEEYYKDVTFEEENKLREQEEAGYDDQPFLPYQKNNTAEIEKASTPKVPAKPIEIKGEDFYRKDYINYYYHRKKKGNGTPDSPPSFSDEINKSKKLIWDRINEKRAEREN